MWFRLIKCIASGRRCWGSFYDEKILLGVWNNLLTPFIWLYNWMPSCHGCSNSQDRFAGLIAWFRPMAVKPATNTYTESNISADSACISPPNLYSRMWREKFRTEKRAKNWMLNKWACVCIVHNKCYKKGVELTHQVLLIAWNPPALTMTDINQFQHLRRDDTRHIVTQWHSYFSDSVFFYICLSLPSLIRVFRLFARVKSHRVVKANKRLQTKRHRPSRLTENKDGRPVRKIRNEYNYLHIRASIY